ncbi:MAG: hypothetical protein MHM6MM_004109 [Cercozoa sp. M6MM]
MQPKLDGTLVYACSCEQPRMQLDLNKVQHQLTRRRPGQSAITTARNETDQVEVWSGAEQGITLGTPLLLLVRNKDRRPQDYSHVEDTPRPSHADYAYQQKYGVRASSGGGRSSARETVARVAAGTVAEQFLLSAFGVEIVAWVSQVDDIKASRELETAVLTRESVDAHMTRCPDQSVQDAMQERILQLKSEGDSCGGIVTCVARNVPAGWGEPVFDKLEAVLAHAMLSIPACRGFEIGSGFEAACAHGSKHNDRFVRGDREGTLATVTNRSGGVQGGVSNGADVVFRVVFKPPASIGKAQHTANFGGSDTVLHGKGRHDPV